MRTIGVSRTAFEHYREIFGGHADYLPLPDNGDGVDGIMHARLVTDHFTLMASDAQPGAEDGAADRLQLFVESADERTLNMGDNITVAVHIGRIREKLEDDPASPKLLQTVWGVGYRLRTDAV